MAFTCPVGFDVEQLRGQVRATYDRVAREPGGEFHFHRGLRYAVDFLHYDESELVQLPAQCTARFAGVGNPLRIGPVHPGERVLDHACGGGMDVLLAARRTGPKGAVIGVDMTPAMCEAAREAADQAGMSRTVEFTRDSTSSCRSKTKAWMSSCRTASSIFHPTRRTCFARFTGSCAPAGGFTLRTWSSSAS